MGSAEAMCVRYEGFAMAGCSPEQGELCRDFARRLVSCAAGVIEGIKPVALFSYTPPRALVPERSTRHGSTCAAVREVICAYGRGVSALGLHVEPVGCRRGRTMLVAYRTELVQRVLDDERSRALLAGAGFDVRDVRRLMGSVRERLCRYYHDQALRDRAPVSGACQTQFPHELGVLFGYPLADVLGFMSGQAPTCRGAWCAYGDPAEAHRRFEAVARREESCRQRYRSGIQLRELLVGAA